MTPPIPLPGDLSALVDGDRWLRDTGGESGGEIFRLDRDGTSPRFLKYGTGTVAGAICDEMARLEWLAGKLAVPTVHHFVRTADAAWLLTSAMPGRSIDAILAEDPARIDDLAEPLGRFLSAIHALPADECPFVSAAPLRLADARRRLDRGLVDTDDFGDDHAGWTAAQVWDEMTALLPIAFDRVVTHGDFSLGNIFVEDGRITGCIDVGLAGVADRYQDIAILWENLGEWGEQTRQRFLDAYGLGQPDMRKLRFHRCLDEFF